MRKERRAIFRGPVGVHIYDGRPLEAEELKAAVELLESTKGTMYTNAVLRLLPGVEKHFDEDAIWAVKALPYMDNRYRSRVETLVRRYREEMDQLRAQNPCGVPITTANFTFIAGGVVPGELILHPDLPENKEDLPLSLLAGN